MNKNSVDVANQVRKIRIYGGGTLTQTAPTLLTRKARLAATHEHKASY